MPKVSVIMPVYNVEKYLEKSIESVVNQTIEDIEIIIVNDGSTDKSIGIIKKYLEKYKNIKYLEKENGGLSSARNFGLKYATGEYIAFLDSDDYVELSMYEEMYKIAKEENADMVECDFIWEYPNKKRNDVGKIYFSKKEAMEKARVVAWNKIIKRQVVQKANVDFPIGLRYEDIEFFYKILPYLNKISFVKKCFVHYIQRPNSIVNTQNIRTKEIFNILDNVIQYYKENNIFNEYKEELEYMYIRILLCSSLKRMCNIYNINERKEALKETWTKLNYNFPNWKKNRLLKKVSFKNLYLKSCNKYTYKAYCFIFSLF